MLGKPSPSYFAAALDALDAEPELTWLVTDDVDADVRGARLFGMKTALVRTGKFRPEALESAETSPDIVVSSLAHFPALLEEDLTGGVGAVKVGVDIIEIERIERALERPGFRERCFTDAERDVLRLAGAPGAELRGPVRRKGGRRQGARLRRSLHLEGDRDRRAAEAGRAPLGANGGVRGAVQAGPIDLSMTHSREIAAAIAVVSPREDG